MNNRKYLKVLAVALVAVACAGLVVVPMLAWGDAGGFSGGSDFGGGGGYSGGGGGYSYSGGSGGGYSYSGGSSGGGGGIVDIVIVIIIVLIVMSMANKRRTTGGYSSQRQPAGAQRTDRTMLHPISELQAADPAFSVPEMQEKISNIYVQLQNNWTAKDLEPMRPYLDDKLYATFDRQLDAYRNADRTNRVDNIAVLGVNLDGWYQTSSNDCLVATVRTRIVDYDIDDRTGSVLSGSPTAEKFMTYEYTLIRTRGGKTRVQTAESEAVNCPNCGAPLNINRTSRCPYCDSIVTLDTFDWVVSQIKGLSQQTVGR